MWNEPDIFYWGGTHEEFCKLYDYTEAAIHDVLSSLRFGGPATCGALEPNDRAAAFLRDFLKHTKSGKNFKTGKIGTRIDFTSFHAKGGRYTFTTSKTLTKTPSIKRVLDQIKICGTIIKEAGYGNLECILSEVDPDGWAAGGRFDNPTLNFRNTEYYASYLASSYKNIYDLAVEMKMDIRTLAWAFMFEGERCFEGTRAFSTQGINKAVFNVLKMYTKLGSQLISFSSSRDQNPIHYKDNWGEGDGAEIDGWATLTENNSLAAFIYCHEDTWDTGSVYPVECNVENAPFNDSCKITHYRIDQEHSNAYTEWVRQGRPDYPKDGQYDAIKARDSLELLEPVKIAVPINGKLSFSFTMPIKSVSLIIIEQT
jgi:xylan 1,4-beta-xylosidase